MWLEIREWYFGYLSGGISGSSSRASRPLCARLPPILHLRFPLECEGKAGAFFIAAWMSRCCMISGVDSRLGFEEPHFLGHLVRIPLQCHEALNSKVTSLNPMSLESRNDRPPSLMSGPCCPKAGVRAME